MTTINFDTFSIRELIGKGYVGVMFQKNSPGNRYRDTVTFYKDNKIHFVRYCYGESAGPVAELWSKGGLAENGLLNWDHSKCQYSEIAEAAPSRLSSSDEQGTLYFDDKQTQWIRTKEYSTDKLHGYPWFKSMFLLG